MCVKKSFFTLASLRKVRKLGFNRKIVFKNETPPEFLKKFSTYKFFKSQVTKAAQNLKK